MSEITKEEAKTLSKMIKENTTFKDKLHRRNAQIKDLQGEITKLKQPVIIKYTSWLATQLMRGYKTSYCEGRVIVEPSEK